MALVKRRMSQKKMLVLIGVLLVIVLVGFYYLFGSKTGGIVGTSTDPVMQRMQTDLSEVQKVRNSLLPSLETLFDDVRFRELKQYGAVPVEPGKIGRDNPFQPL